MIGTVQFGIPYGIANNQGQPSNEEVMAIMKHAHESGVDEYDTAAAYGESEKRLGYNFKELGITKMFRSTQKLNLYALKFQNLQKNLRKPSSIHLNNL